MSDTRIFNTSKNIALVAHDNKKTDFISWAETNKAVLGLELDALNPPYITLNSQSPKMEFET